MKTYVVLQDQQGEGCDYTIGCGKNWLFIEAETIEEAAKKYALKVVEDNGENWLEDQEYPYTQHAERTIEKATIIGVSSSLVMNAKDIERPVEELRKQLRKPIEEKKRQQLESKEKAEFERLKKKYG